MATPNYQFEKRRRELDKKAKKEEKRKLKLEAGKASNAESPDAPPEDSSPGITSDQQQDNQPGNLP